MPVITKTNRITVSSKNFGWVKVEYKDVGAGKTIEANIRPKMWEDIQRAVDSGKKYKSIEGVFYTKWRTETTAGRLYSDRRQVEGMLKVAIERGDTRLIDEITEVLKKGDDAVSRWYQKWLSEHSEEEIEEFYDYIPDDGSGVPTYLLEMEF